MSERDLAQLTLARRQRIARQLRQDHGVAASFLLEVQRAHHALADESHLLGVRQRRGVVDVDQQSDPSGAELVERPAG
jgi:hypothetical protein